jgi:hypothetical protein
MPSRDDDLFAAMKAYNRDMRWEEIETDEQTAERAADQLELHRNGLLDGMFWADRIKLLRDCPLERQTLALDNLPLPAAFREAAIATRALLRTHAKGTLDHERELRRLYWLAAINSFGLPYSSRLQSVGYNVIMAIPGATIARLPFTYDQLGYLWLAGLNATDRKWLVDAWGEPAAHSTLQTMHQHLWDHYESVVALNMAQRENEVKDLIREYLRLGGDPAALPFG